MKRPNPTFAIAMAIGMPSLAPEFTGTSPHVRTAKPTGHGATGSRSKAERNWRKAKRRQRAKKK